MSIMLYFQPSKIKLVLVIDLCATLPCDEGFDCVMNNTSEVRVVK